MGGGEFINTAQQMQLPQQTKIMTPIIEIHNQAPIPVKEKSFPTEAAWAVAVTIIAAAILAWLKGKK